MIDTITNVVSSAVKPDTLPMVLGTTGVSGLIGKILWDLIKQPKTSYDDLSKRVANIETSVAVIQTDVKWLINDLQKRSCL